MSALTIAVEDMETACRAAVAHLTTQQALDLTLRLLALRRAAGMPARLCGPSGKLGPTLRVVRPDGPDAA